MIYYQGPVIINHGYLQIAQGLSIYQCRSIRPGGYLKFTKAHRDALIGGQGRLKIARIHQGLVTVSQFHLTVIQTSNIQEIARF